MIIDGYLEKGVVLSMQDGIKPSEILAAEQDYNLAKAEGWSEEDYTEFLLEKGDRSHLVKKMITDSRGHRTSRWVRAGAKESEGDSKKYAATPEQVERAGKRNKLRGIARAAYDRGNTTLGDSVSAKVKREVNEGYEMGDYDDPDAKPNKAPRAKRGEGVAGLKKKEKMAYQAYKEARGDDRKPAWAKYKEAKNDLARASTARFSQEDAKTAVKALKSLKDYLKKKVGSGLATFNDGGSRSKYVMGNLNEVMDEFNYFAAHGQPRSGTEGFVSDVNSSLYEVEKHLRRGSEGGHSKEGMNALKVVNSLGALMDKKVSGGSIKSGLSRLSRDATALLTKGYGDFEDDYTDGWFKDNLDL